jgi:acyl-CoA thioester hydrolase
MSVVHHETFRVRYYECDAYGHLTPINYLRWMQEAAFGASMAVGYDFARYSELRHLWLVRETEIEYIVPLDYGTDVTVRTWVADFRRAHSRRRYEFMNAKTGEVAARASTDWVYINTQTLRPVTVPQEMQSAFCPDGPPEADTPWRRFPQAPSPPPDVFTTRIQVEWRDIDTMWHVNNAVYLRYIEGADARSREARCWPNQSGVEDKFDMAMQAYRIEYRQPAQMGDELDIASWFSEDQEAPMLRHYTIRRANDQALIARARTNWMRAETHQDHFTQRA